MEGNFGVGKYCDASYSCLTQAYIHVSSCYCCFYTVSNSLLIKVSNVQVREYQEDMHEMEGDEGLFQELKKAATPGNIAQSILEKQWRHLFSGLIVARVNFLDDSLAVFDLNFLGRVTGKHICARKEPDFF